MKRIRISHRRFFTLALAATLAAILATPTRAAFIVKANNADALNATTSWVGGVVPLSADVAVWDNTITTSRNPALGDDISVSGIQVSNPQAGVQSIVATAGKTLTIGADGVDMSAATVNFVMSCAVVLGADQIWNVGTSAARTLTISSAASLTGNQTITKSGPSFVDVKANTSGFSGLVKIAAGTWVGNKAGLEDGAYSIQFTGNGILRPESSFTYAPPRTMSIDSGFTGTLRSSGAANVFAVSSIISGNGNLAAAGPGIVELYATNTYAGSTLISGGSLRARDGVGIPATSPVEISTGIWETPVNLARNLGAGAGAIRKTGNTGGFSAWGADVEVSLNGGADLTWADTHFVAGGNGLVLNSSTATNRLTFRNGLVLGTTARSIQVNADYAEIPYAITGSGAPATHLSKSGNGVLVLTGTNSFSGAFTIAGTFGSVHMRNGIGLPITSRLSIGTGTWGTDQTITRALGTTAGEFVQVTGIAGFAAVGADIAVNLGGGAISWGVTAFNPTAFYLNDTWATHNIVFQNTLNMGTAVRTFRVTALPPLVSTISGDMNNSGAGGLTKDGDGTLVLSGGGSMTGTGLQTISAGTLRITTANKLSTVGRLVLSGATFDMTNVNQTVATAVVTPVVGVDTKIVGTGILTTGGFTNNGANADAVIEPILAGVGANFTKAGTGSGVIYLMNPANSYSGTLAVPGGNLAVTALGDAINGTGTILLGGHTAGVTGTLIHTGTVHSVTTRAIHLVATTGGSGILVSEAPGTMGVGDVTIASGGAGTKTFTLTGTSTGTNRVMGVISVGSGTALAVAKTGAGTWHLSGNNSYGGLTTVSEGMLVIEHDNGMGTTALGGTVVSGATLAFQGGITIGAENLTSVIGQGVDGGGAIRNLSGDNSFGGNIVRGTGGARINSDADTLTLTGTASGNQPHWWGGAGTIVMDGDVTGTAVATLTKDGTGTLALNHAANTYSGRSDIDAGSLLVNGILTATAVVQINNGGTLGGEGTVTRSVTNMAGGVVAPGNAGVGFLTVGSQLTYAAGSSNIIEFADAANYDQIVTTLNNGLRFEGPDDSVAVYLFDEGATTPWFTDGPYPLFQYNGTVQGNGIGSLYVANAQPGSNYEFSESLGWVVLTISSAKVWDGGGADDDWTTDENWSGDTAPASGAQLRFAGSTRLNNVNTFADNTQFAGIVFEAGAGGFTINGAPVNLTGNLVNESANTQTVNLDVVLDGNDRLIAATAGPIVVSGEIGETGGTFGIEKNGNHLVILEGGGDFGGAVTISAGALRAAHNTALGATSGGVTVPSGSALELAGGITIGDEALSVMGTGVSGGGALRNISGLNTYGGLVTMGGATLFTSDAGTMTLDVSVGNAIVGTGLAVTFDGAGDIVVADPIATAAAGTITKSGTGRLTLSGANTHTGLTSIDAGALRAMHASALGTTAGATIVANGAALELDGGTLIAVNEFLTLTGTGIGNGGALRNISGNNAFQGPTTLGIGGARINSDSGTLTFRAVTTDVGNDLTVGGAGDTLQNTAPITGGGRLIKDGAGTFTMGVATPAFAGDTLVAAGELRNGINNGLPNGHIFIGNGATLNMQTFTKTVAGVVVTNGNISGSGALTSTGGFIFENGTISTALAGASDVRKTTSGTVTMSGAGTYTGTTYLEGGTLSIGNATAMGVVGSAKVVFGAASDAVLQLNGLNVTVIQLEGDSSTRVENGGVGTSVLTVNTAAGNTFDGVLRDGTGGGTLALTKGTAGQTLTLGGTNTYSGTTTVGLGTIKLGASNVIPDGAGKGDVTFIAGGVLDLAGNSEAINAIAGAAGHVTNSVGTATLTFGAGDATSLAATSVFRDGGPAGTTLHLTKTGTGEQHLTGVIWISGNLTVEDGILQLGGANLYSGDTIVNGGILRYGVATGVPSGAGRGNVILNGGVLDLKALIPTVNGLSGSGTVDNMSGAATYTLTVGANDQSSTFAGTIQNTSGTVALTKTGTGTITLTGASSYNGLTTIQANGALRIENDTALGTTAGATTVLAGGALELAGGITVGAETLTLNGTGLSNGGVLRNLSGNNTWGGALTIATASRINSDAGTLTLDVASGNIFAAGGAAVTFGGAGHIVVQDPITFTTGSLTKDGTGTLRLNATNTFTSGVITVNDGTLLANGDITGTAALTVASGGRLGGVGAISRAVVSQGGSVMTPGDALVNGGIGELTVNTWQLDSGMTNVFEFTDTSVRDRVIVATSGGLTINGGTFYLYHPGTTTMFDADGIYNLIQHTGAIGGAGESALTVANENPSKTYVFDVSGGWVRLTISSTTAWTGGDADDDYWSSPDNWGGSTPSAGSELVFDTGNRLSNTNDLGANIQFAGITFEATAGGFELDGNVINLTANIQNQSTAAQTIQLDLVLDGNDRTVDAAAGPLTISGAIGEIGGTYGLEKTGPFLVTLAGNSDFGGAVTVSAGALRAAHGNALGATTGGVMVPSGTALELAGGITIGAEALSVTGTGVSGGGALRNISGDNAYGGTLTLGGATLIVSDADRLTLNAGGNAIEGIGIGITFGGAGEVEAASPIATGAAGTITKIDSGRLTLSAANTHTGVTSVDVGVLRIAHPTALGTVAGNTVVASGAALEIVGDTVFTLLEPLTLTGMGVANDGAFRNISGNNEFIGPITLGAGGSRINSDAGQLIFRGVTTDVGNDLWVGGAGNTRNQTTAIVGGGRLIKDGVGAFTMAVASTLSGDTLILDGTLVNAAANGIPAGRFYIGNGAMLDMQGFAATVSEVIVTNGVIAGAGVLTAPSGFILESATISAGLAGTGANVTKRTAGTVTLNGPGTFTGTTYIDGGTLTLGHATALGAITVAKVVFGAGSDAVLQLNDQNATIIQLEGDNSARIENGGTGTSVLTVNTAADNTFAGVLQDGAGGVLALTKGTANFTLTLTGTNTYSGTTTAGLGTIKLGAANVIPDGLGKGDLTFIANGIFDVAGHSETVNALAGLAGFITNSVGTATLTIGAGDATGTSTVLIRDGGPGGTTLHLTKIGTGEQTLSGINMISGDVTVNTGTLVLNAANVYSGDTIVNGGILRYGVVGGVPSGAGRGNVQLNGGVLDLKALSPTINGLSGSGTVDNLSGTGTYTLTVGANDQTSSYGGTIQNSSGTVALTKTGTGTLTLTGASTYGGLTTVQANGALRVAHGSALGGTTLGVTVVAGGALELTGGITVTGESLALAGTGVSNGGALRNVSGDNTWVNLITYTTGARINSDAGTLILDVASGNVWAGTTAAITLGGAGDIRIEDPITFTTGSLTKDGTGTLRLSATNTFTSGAVAVNNGTLLVNGDISATSVDLTVASGGRLGGVGSVSRGVVSQAGSVMTPGDPLVNGGIGALTVNTWTLNSGMTNIFQLTDTATRDHVIVVNSGGLTINGGTFYLYAADGVTPFTVDGTYNLIQYAGSLVGSVGSLTVANPQAGKFYTFQTSGGWVQLRIRSYDVRLKTHPVTTLKVALGGVEQTAPFTYNTNGTVSISTPTPQTNIAGNTRYVFTQWTNDIPPEVTTDNPYVFTLSGHTNFTAVFQTQVLATNSVNGFGSVDMSPASGWVVPGSSVTYDNPTPDTFYAFDHWEDSTGSNLGTTIPLVVTVNHPTNIVAVFVGSGGEEVTVQTTPGNAGFMANLSTYYNSQLFNVPDGGTIYVAVTNPVQVNAGTQYRFLNWNDNDVIGPEPATNWLYEVYAPGPFTLTASFDTWRLLTKGGANGTITNHPTTGDNYFLHGTDVFLYPDPNVGFVFSHWSGDASGSAVPLSVTMDAPKSITANYSQVWFVKADAAGANDGTSWANAYTSLATALADKSPGAEIWVAAGVYNPPSTSAALIVGPNDQIFGGFAGTESVRVNRDVKLNESVISGDFNNDDVSDMNGTVPLMTSTGDNATYATVDGFTFRYGKWDVSGARYGGAISRPTSGAAFRIRNSTFRDNVALYGGALGVASATQTIVENCVFFNNEATGGANGGAIYVRRGANSLSVMNSTFFGNTALGGSAEDIYRHISSTMTVKNSILWSSTGSLANNVDNDPAVSYSNVRKVGGPFTGTGNINVDPLFVNTSAGDFRLQELSLSIDSGNSVGAPTTDIWGRSRPLGLGFDMGAYEMSVFVNANLAASPAQGQTVRVDGQTEVTPFTFSVETGTAELFTDAPQTNGKLRYVFQYWSDGTGNQPTGNPHVYNVTIATNWTAVFGTQFKVNALTNPIAGAGTAEVTPADGWVNAGGSASWSATVTDPAWSFDHWAGENNALVSVANPYAIDPLNGPTNLTAVFQCLGVSLLVQADPVGPTLSVDGDDYTSPQAFCWVAFASHALSAQDVYAALPGLTEYRFAGWSDTSAQSESGTNWNYTVPGGDATATANYDVYHRVTGHAQANGTIITNVVTADEFHMEATSLTFTAVPDVGYAFVAWSGSDTTSVNPLTLDVQGPVSLTARFQRVWFVTPTGAGVMNGNGWADAATLPTATAGALAGDQIWVRHGTYTAGVNGAYDFAAISGSTDPALRMFGGFAGTEATLAERPADVTAQPSILNGNGFGRLIHIGNLNFVIDGFTFTGQSGGLAANVGAIYTANTAVNFGYGTGTISRCTFNNNQVAVHFNNTLYRGGNRMENCVFANNTGASIYMNRMSDYRIYNTTFYNNVAYGVSGSGSSSSLRVENCILRDTGPTVGSVASVLITYCCVRSTSGDSGAVNSQFTNDPGFLNPSVGDFRLMAGSLALDNASGVFPATDIAGVARPIGSGADMGAYEGEYALAFDPQTVIMFK